MTEKPFLKNHQGKPMMMYLPWDILEIVARVENHGAEKYARFNWQKGTPDDYLNAAQRHLSKRYQGEHTDPDSKLPHVAMAICDLIYALWLDLKCSKKAQTGIRVEWQEPPRAIEKWIPICITYDQVDEPLICLRDERGGDVITFGKHTGIKVLEWRKIRYQPGRGIVDITPSAAEIESNNQVTESEKE